MSGITDPAQEYFKDGLWAWVTDQWKKLIGDDAGHLQVDIVESGLPAGAATGANQTTMIAALQLVDDLQAALTSVHTDSLDVRLDGQTADVEIKQTAAADLTPGVMGWDGSAWRKLPLLWGYSDRYAEQLSTANAGVGTNSFGTTAVVAGYVHVIQTVSLYNDTNACSVLVVYLYVSGVTTRLIYDPSPVVDVGALWNGEVVLKEGDRLWGEFQGCVAGDDLYFAAWGYKMKVAE